MTYTLTEEQLKELLENTAKTAAKTAAETAIKQYIAMTQGQEAPDFDNASPFLHAHVHIR